MKKTIEREVYLSDASLNAVKAGGMPYGIAGITSKEFNHKAKLTIEIPHEPLTFERIKKECVPMKHLLVDDKGKERLYLGFNRYGSLVTDLYDGGSCYVWEEKQIENWTIK